MNAKTIEQNGYKATEEQVEELARHHTEGMNQVGSTNATYLRVLLVAAQGILGRARGRAPAIPVQVKALNSAHERLYPWVLRGVGGEGIESHRLAIFARTAKTTIVMYARAGHDLRKLKAKDATKTALQAAVQPPEPTDRLERSLKRAQDRAIRMIRRMARGDPDGARERLTEMISALQGALDEIPEARVMSHTLRRTRSRQQPETRVQ